MVGASGQGRPFLLVVFVGLNVLYLRKILLHEISTASHVLLRDALNLKFK